MEGHLATAVLVRAYQPADAAGTAEVFHAAIRTTAAAHYNPDQIDAWVGDEVDLEAWNRRRLATWTIVAELDGHLAGFAGLTEEAELDMLFVHPAAGGRGIARLLIETVLVEARRRRLPRVDTRASRAAQPVFERLGFCIDRSRTDNTIRGVPVPNYDMHIDLSKAPERS